MVSKLELEYRYDKYIESISAVDLIDYGGEDVDRPTKKAVQDDSFNVQFRNLSVNNSHELLLSNDSSRVGIRYLPPDLYNWLAIKLTEVLQVGICEDHRQYWLFTHEFSNGFDIFPSGLVENLKLLIHLVLHNPASSKSSDSEILRDAGTLASYLAYSTLEGFVKVACRKDIKMNGEIRDGRRIREMSHPSKRNFKSSDDGDGICSNIGMLLWHLETEVSRVKNRLLLQEMRREVGEMFGHPSDKVYGLLNEIRNDSLHGRDRASKERGVFLNYICLVLWCVLN